MGERGPLPVPYARRRNKRHASGQHVTIARPPMPRSLVGEAKRRSLRTERLIGMFVLLQCSDGVDPFEHEQMRSVITNQQLTEDDRAHILQMIRQAPLSQGR